MGDKAADAGPALMTQDGQSQIDAPALIKKIVARPGFFSMLFLAAAVYYGVWECFSVERADTTRISEHALMPGIALPQFNKDGLETRFLKELAAIKGANERRAYIVRELESNGMEAEVVEWNTPSLFRNATGASVAGVVRALRSTGAESMAVAVDINGDHEVAMAMALAAHSRERSYWARDMFFVFVDGGAAGMDAWLAAYHGTRQEGGIIKTSRLRGGYMIGAIVLELPQSLARSRKAIASLVGLNGQLPNLDLFNTLVRITARARLNMNVVVYPGKENSDRQDALVPLRFLLSQAFTPVEGMHSVFGKYGVQALKIEAPRMRIGEQYVKTEFLVESMLRSLNNLHERFHQSFFLYVLVSPSHFVSVAFFLPLVGLIAAPMVIVPLHAWLRLPPGGFVPQASPALLVLCGLATFLSLRPLVHYGLLQETGASHVLLVALVAPVGLFIRVGSRSLDSLRFLVLFSIVIFCGCLSLLNYGLGLFSTAVVVLPAIFAAWPTKSRLLVLLRTLLLLLLNPLSIVMLGRLVIYSLDDTKWLHSLDANVAMTAITTWVPSLLLSTLVSIMDQHFLFGCWHLPLLCLAAAPAWNCLLTLASSVDEDTMVYKRDLTE